MKGYHYTSQENWEKIQDEGGMKRYKIRKDEFRHLFPNGVNGVWLWKDNPTGASHAGNILYQVGTKGSPWVVKLEVDYDPNQILRYNKSKIHLPHKGHVNNWEYHDGETGIIIKEDIPLQSISVVGSYNTIQRLQ